jgi:hypothetical protein
MNIIYTQGEGKENGRIGGRKRNPKVRRNNHNACHPKRELHVPTKQLATIFHGCRTELLPYRSEGVEGMAIDFGAREIVEFN